MLTIPRHLIAHHPRTPTPTHHINPPHPHHVTPPPTTHTHTLTHTLTGKRSLPAALRSRFTELWVAEPSTQHDLQTLVNAYVQGRTGGQTGALVEGVVEFYVAAKHHAVGVVGERGG